jgi:hypothetical protein
MRFTRISPLLAGAMLALAFSAWPSADARAISISVASAVDNTVANLTGGGSGDRAQGRALTTTNAGGNTGGADLLGVPGQVGAATRFAANVAADRSAATGGSTATASDAVNYTVSFNVAPVFAITQYTVSVSTSILGAVTALDDGSGVSGSGTAVMTAVSGFLSNVANASLNLASAANQNGTSNTSGVATQFSANNVLNLGPFTGPQTITLKFTWTMTASSPQSLIGGDEQAVRLGFAGPLGGASADEYPGVGNRNINNDGHFVTVQVTPTLIPEPGTWLLMGLGLLGLPILRRRVRKA